VNKPNDLKALSRLTDAAFAARQAGMGALRQKEQDLRDTLAALDAARKDRAAALTDQEPDPALLAGADLMWHRWIETRRVALNTALSRNRVAQEAARAALSLAFGRAQATDGLLTKAALVRAKAKSRRDDAAS
jgi:TPP-dependent trihydroxycyclohexane-1,2-dione (THcHDO) dehydratase